jgi:hypothetical protein
MGKHYLYMTQSVLLMVLSWGCDNGTSNGTGTNTSTGTDTSTATGSCSVPASCGGAVDGTWQIDSTCVVGDVAAVLVARLDMPPACNDAYKSGTTTSTGTLSFDGGNKSDNVTTTTSMVAEITSACASAFTGMTVTLSAAACPLLQTYLTDSNTGTTATCTFTSPNCNCTVVQQTTSTAQASYSIAGNSLTFLNDAKPLDYCVSGTTMTASQASTDLNGLTFVYTLHKI